MGFPASTRRSQGALRVSRQRLLGPANSISPKSTRSYGTPGPPRQDRTDLESCATGLRLFRYAVSAFLRLATHAKAKLRERLTDQLGAECRGGSMRNSPLETPEAKSRGGFPLAITVR